MPTAPIEPRADPRVEMAPVDPIALLAGAGTCVALTHAIAVGGLAPLVASFELPQDATGLPLTAAALAGCVLLLALLVDLG